MRLPIVASLRTLESGRVDMLDWTSYSARRRAPRRSTCAADAGIEGGS